MAKPKSVHFVFLSIFLLCFIAIFISNSTQLQTPISESNKRETLDVPNVNADFSLRSGTQFDLQASNCMVCNKPFNHSGYIKETNGNWVLSAFGPILPVCSNACGQQYDSVRRKLILEKDPGEGLLP